MFTSCSLLIHSTRKSASDFLPTGATRDQIRKNFGSVVSSKEFSTPRDLASIPELKDQKDHFPDFRLPKTIGYDNYRYYGAIQSDMASTVVGMGLGMTLGLSELYLIPEEFSNSKLEKQQGNPFRVYYAEDGHWILYRHGEDGGWARYIFNFSYWETRKP